MPSDYLPSEDHLIRYVAWQRLAKDDDGETVIGILPQAFRRRQSEDTLSCTWVEFHGCDGLSSNLTAAVNTIRGSKVTVGAKSAFAYARNTDITTVCLNRGRRIRVIHEPEEDNKAHVGVHSWPDDLDDLIAAVAADAWSRFVLNRDVPYK